MANLLPLLTVYGILSAIVVVASILAHIFKWK